VKTPINIAMKKILFAIKGYEYLAQKLLACADFEKG